MGVNDEKEKARQGIAQAVKCVPKRCAIFVEGYEEDGPAAILHPWGFWVSPDFHIEVEATTTGQLCRIKPTESAKFKKARRNIDQAEVFARGSADR